MEDAPQPGGQAMVGLVTEAWRTERMEPLLGTLCALDGRKKVPFEESLL